MPSSCSWGASADQLLSNTCALRFWSNFTSLPPLHILFIQCVLVRRVASLEEFLIYSIVLHTVLIMRLVSAWALLAAVLPSVVDSSRLTPPVLPLVVRNPYLSTWLQNARDPPWERWPMFWTGQEIGFSVLASVAEPRTVFPLMGRPQDSLRSEGDK